MSTTTTSRIGRAALAGLALAALTVSGALPAAASSTPTSALVSADAFGTTYAAAGQKTWLVEEWGGGSHAFGTGSFDARPTAELVRTGTGSVVNLFRSFGAGVRPTDARAVLDGSSFSYSGANVNFQLAMFYTPADPAAYGPAGTTAACRPAVDDGVTIPGACFTILKFEPGATASGEYLNFFPGTVQQPFGGVGHPGWWPTQQVGPFSSTNRTGTLDQLLAQMSDYQIYAVGASVGSGTAAGSSWLLELTFGGTRHSFGTAPTPAAPTPPPAADTAALEQVITAQNVDVAVHTDRTSAGGGDLAAIDPTRPLDLHYAGWEHPVDAFVDAYLYSTATHLGTFPVVDGEISLTGLDLSGAAAGQHHLVLVGQTSGAFAVAQLRTLAVLAVSGTDASAPIAVGAGMLLLGAALVVGMRRRRSLAA